MMLVRRISPRRVCLLEERSQVGGCGRLDKVANTLYWRETCASRSMVSPIIKGASIFPREAIQADRGVSVALIWMGDKQLSWIICQVRVTITPIWWLLGRTGSSILARAL